MVDDRGPTLLRICIIPTIISILVFGLRMTWRLRQRQCGIDDYMLCGAMAILIVQSAFGLEAVHWGFGKHRADLSSQEASEALMYFYFMQITYKILGMSVKLAFLFLYLRIFQSTKFQIFTKFMMANVILGAIAFTLTTVFQCTPVYRAWKLTTPGLCINRMAFWYAHSLWNALCDCVIFAMPMPVITSLHMAGLKKFGLASVFLLGAFTCAASILRMTTLASSSRSMDPTWGSMPATAWTQIESSTAIICGCLPALRAPAIEFYRRLFRRNQNQAGGNSDYMHEIKFSTAEPHPQLHRFNPDDAEWGFPNERMWYESKFQTSPQVLSSETSASDHEDVVSIVKKLDVQISHAHDSPLEDQGTFTPA